MSVKYTMKTAISLVKIVPDLLELLQIYVNPVNRSL